MPEGAEAGPPRAGKRSVEDDSVTVKKKAAELREATDPHFHKQYVKPGYRRVFPDTVSGELTVYVESMDMNDKLGNRNPLILAAMFKNEIKGVLNIKRINATKIGIIFKQAINANNFLTNDNFLTKNKMKAYIPARAVECIGVVRFVPTSISTEDLFKKLSSSYEIVAVRRFTKREGGEVRPFGTVALTFLASSLPECVYLDIVRFKVHEYIAPLLQCFKCFKFNHGAKICRSAQKCSICSNDHHYSQCESTASMKCVNCGGAHLAISRECPVKQEKLKLSQIKNSSYSYAHAVSQGNHTLTDKYNENFPTIKKMSIPKPKATESVPTIPTNNENDDNTLIDQIINNENVLKGLVGALVALGNGNKPITSSFIKEILIKTLKHG